MNDNDRIYGAFDIQETVLLELMRTSALQRLHGVLQHGITGLLGVTRPTTRFEHSIGVMLLVQRMGAPLKEQIAALLHDVSHTAFSHVIDYVFNDYDQQGYHETVKQEYLASSDLPQVLARYGYDWEDFIEEDNYFLLEQPTPRLCADRLDYFLRDSIDLGLATFSEVSYALAHLVVHEGRIVCKDLHAARWMAYTFIQADEVSWANFREVGLYELTAQCIRDALNLGEITKADLWSTDQVLWEKLQAISEPVFHSRLELINSDTQFVWDEERPDFWVGTKLRTIDPEVLVNGQLHPLSTLDKDFDHHRRAYLDRKAGKWPMRVVTL
jgi:HD superfamily phosphohydrolase